MSQDLDQIVLLIGSVMGAVIGLLFLMAWLEPRPADAPAVTPKRVALSRTRLVLARRILGLETPAERVDVAA